MTDLRREYVARHARLEQLATRLEAFVRTHLAGCARIDRVSARAKSVERFLGKAAKLKQDGQPKYTDPLHQIQDQVGVRIVTFYLSDVTYVTHEVLKYLKAIEVQRFVPDSPDAFGYEGQHFVVFVPSDVAQDFEEDEIPRFFELQIKTLFQHAWAEAEHDLGYKPSTPLTNEQKRRIAFTAAQAWGADLIFEELHIAMSPGDGDLNAN